MTTFAVAPMAEEEIAPKHKRDVSQFTMINLTAMCDVTYQLLIFFIAITNFAREGTLDSKLPDLNPRAAQQVITQPINIVIGVGIDTRADIPPIIEIDRQSVNIKDVYSVLAAKAGEDRTVKADKPVLIQSAPNVPWEHAMRVFNSATRAGYAKIVWKLGEAQR